MTVFLVSAVALLLVIVVTALISLRILFKWSARLESFMTPAKEGEKSALAILVGTIGAQLTDSFVSRFATLNGTQKAGQAHAEQGVMGAIMQDSIPPWAVALLGQMPALRKTLVRNPQMMGFALQQLQNLAANKQPGGEGQGPPPSPGNGSKPGALTIVS